MRAGELTQYLGALADLVEDQALVRSMYIGWLQFHGICHLLVTSEHLHTHSACTYTQANMHAYRMKISQSKYFLKKA